MLEAARVDDRDINLALQLTGVVSNGQPSMRAAITACLRAFADADLSDAEIMAITGWNRESLTKWQRLSGLRQGGYPKGWTTKQGPATEQPGEIWREIPGWRYSVSNFGRVRGRTGQLLTTSVKSNGLLYVNLWNPANTALILHKVAGLVLAAFRPEMAPGRLQFINGDRADASLTNIIPARLDEGGGRPDAQPLEMRGGNTVGQRATGSVPFFEPLWAEANAVVPAFIEDHVRKDLISGMVVMIIEGRARSMRDALKAAQRDYNAVMGTWKERSLNATIPGTDNLTGLDMLDSEVERC